MSMFLLKMILRSWKFRLYWEMARISKFWESSSAKTRSWTADGMSDSCKQTIEQAGYNQSTRQFGANDFTSSLSSCNCSPHPTATTRGKIDAMNMNSRIPPAGYTPRARQSTHKLVAQNTAINSILMWVSTNHWWFIYTGMVLRHRLHSTCFIPSSLVSKFLKSTNTRPPSSLPLSLSR